MESTLFFFDFELPCIFTQVPENKAFTKKWHMNYVPHTSPFNHLQRRF